MADASDGLIDVWGLTSQNHNMTTRDTLVEGSGYFDHLGFFHAPTLHSTRASAFHVHLNAATVAGIQTRGMKLRSFSVP